MSNNIHGINNLRNSNNNEGRFPMMGSGPSGNPREESFGSFLKDFCCPTFVFKSVIFFVSVLDVLIYIITLFFGINMNPNELLAPKTETLDAFGMKNPLKIKEGQIWRLITFAFLHANLVHVVINVFSQIIIGSFVESVMGSKKITLLYLLSAFGGGVFSCLISNNNGVGASVSIYGLLGAYIGYFFMNWHALDRSQGPSKYFNLMFMLFLVMMNISFGFSNPIIDNYGNIGGLIFGFFLIFVIHSPDEPGDGMCCPYRIWYWISFTTLAFLYIGGLIIFFTVRKV